MDREKKSGEKGERKGGEGRDRDTGMGRRKFDLIAFCLRKKKALRLLNTC